LRAAGEAPSVLGLSRREAARVANGITDPVRQGHWWSAFTRRTARWTEDRSGKSLMVTIVNEFLFLLQKAEKENSKNK